MLKGYMKSNRGVWLCGMVALGLSRGVVIWEVWLCYRVRTLSFFFCSFSFVFIVFCI